MVDVRKGIRSKNAAPYSSLTPLEGECYEGEVQPYRKTDYKPDYISADLYGRQCVSTRVLSVRSRHL